VMTSEWIKKVENIFECDNKQNEAMKIMFPVIPQDFKLAIEQIQYSL